MLNLKTINPKWLSGSRVYSIKNRKIGVLITDHNVRSALEMVDRAYIVFEGKIISQGDPKTIIENNEVRRVYLGNSF